jgi:hypothetical protein
VSEEGQGQGEHLKGTQEALCLGTGAACPSLGLLLP